MAARWVRGSVFIKKAVILNLFQNLPLGAFGIVVIPEEFSRGSVVSLVATLQKECGPINQMSAENMPPARCRPQDAARRVTSPSFYCSFLLEYMSRCVGQYNRSVYEERFYVN